MLRSRTSLVSLLVVSTLVFSGVLLADQCLETYNASLTTYLPSGKTKVQNVRPRAEQRGVNVDGSMRAAPGIPAAVAGNPFENVWSGTQAIGGVRLDTGAYNPFEIDIALPAPGFKWLVGRSFNSRQDDSGPFNSDGYQGRNWFQTSQPELQFYAGATDDLDLIYLVYGADRYVEFKRKATGSPYFKGQNGAAGFFEYISGSPDEWVYTGPDGIEIRFLGGNTTSHHTDWQLWKISDRDSNVAYVGSSANAAAAMGSDGFDGSGRITKAYDSANRRYTSTYSSHDSVTRLDSVVAEVLTGGSWSSSPTTIIAAQVDYSYYGTGNSFGDVGALRTVTLTTPLSDSGISDIRQKHYRYYTGSYNVGNNPGYPYTVKYVVDFEGCRKQDWADATFDQDFESLTDDTSTSPNIAEFASEHFEYNTAHQISHAWFQGQCGCGGGSNGTYEFAYEPRTGTYGVTTGYDNIWVNRTVVKRPDDSYLTQYFDEVGQALSQIITNTDPAGSPSQTWVTCVSRDSLGCVVQIGYPDNITGYTHNASPYTSGTITQDGTNGLVRNFLRATSGDMKGFLTARLFKAGSATGGTYEASNSWESKTKTFGSYALTRPLLDKTREFPTAQTTETGYNETDHDYTLWSGESLVIEKADTISPAVPYAENGSNGAITTSVHYKKDGAVDFEKDGNGSITYHQYSGGLMIKQIVDADTTSLSPPSGFSSSGSPVNLVTDYAYLLGGAGTATGPGTGSDRRVQKWYTTKLKDRRVVRLEYPHFDTATGKYYGPVNYTVLNQAEKIEVEGVIGVATTGSSYAQTDHIDENQSTVDPITAVAIYTGGSGAFGGVKQLTTYIYNDVGTELQEERRYFVVPSSGAGTESANYDPTTYFYDGMGRQIKVVTADGTITRSVFDLLGRNTSSWLGTDDSSFPSAGGTDNMVKTEELTYDSGYAGKNGLLTSRIEFVESTSTNQRETTYAYDSRGNVLLENRPQDPDILYLYDNQERVIAIGAYTATSTWSDPTASTAANRRALSQTFYDERGQVYRTQRHNIDASDGSNDDSLPTNKWYDKVGRVIKVDGGQLTKTTYDGAGRVTAEYALASVNENDTDYSDADDVSGDIVLVQNQVAYDARGRVVLESAISRFHTDLATPTGSLDDNVDGGTPNALKLTATDIKGRAQIQANWYDAVDRLEDQVDYGTNGGSTFDRTSLSVPSRSDTELRTTYTFGADGTLLQVQDPKGLKTRHEYDAAGRSTATISNYVDGVPPTPYESTTEDNFVRYEYADGLMTKLWVDYNGDGTVETTTAPLDQVTTYTYGVTKGTGTGDSKISSKQLLAKVQYPESTDATNDVVKFAYNAQGQQVYKRDQATTGDTGDFNEFETVYDDAGRETARKVTDTRAIADTAVQRIATAYTALGQVDTVTQYTTPTGSTVVDEVKYLYDGWGNVTNFRQDMDSAVGGGAYYETAYAYSKTTTGRNTIRRTSETIGGKTFTLNYASSGSPDVPDVSSRVHSIVSGSTTYVKYDYLGASQVVGTTYDEPDVFSRQCGASAGDYSDLDRFNRVTTSKWTKDLATDVDFYHVDIAYDRDSNITSSDEADAATNGHGHVGFDTLYTMDNLNRLSRSLEGKLVSSSIASSDERSDQIWTLTQTGNWSNVNFDLNHDNAYSGADEYDETRTHNKVNEILDRDTNSNAPVEYSLAYDPAGNLTDDGENYLYVWDAFGRLRYVKNRTSPYAVVAEYRYNGLGYRIAVHEDTDLDNDVDGSDLWYYSAYDERWRMVATYRGSDTDPKERFVHQQAGDGGYGGSSYIDFVAFREKDANTAWTTASDSVLEERLYYCQNQHADVVALATAAGGQREMDRYSAYGVPFGLPVGDANSSGIADTTDRSVIQGWINTNHYDVRADYDLDGSVTSGDKAEIASLGLVALGRGDLSSGAVRNRRGVAGHEFNSKSVGCKYHIRSREFDAENGKWLSRDPERLDTLRDQSAEAFYGYCFGSPATFVDYVGQSPSLVQDPAKMAPSKERPGKYTPRWTRIKNFVRGLPEGVSCKPQGPQSHGGHGCHVQLQCWAKKRRQSTLYIRIPVPEWWCGTAPPPMSFPFVPDVVWIPMPDPDPVLDAVPAPYGVGNGFGGRFPIPSSADPFGPYRTPVVVGGVTAGVVVGVEVGWGWGSILTGIGEALVIALNKTGGSGMGPCDPRRPFRPAFCFGGPVGPAGLPTSLQGNN